MINIGGLDMTLAPITKRQESLQAQLRTKGASGFDSVANLLLLTIFQCLCCIGYLLGGDPAHYITIIQGFGGIMLAQWVLFIFYAIIRRSAFEVETVAFFLCTMGMAALCSIKPAESGKQLFAMLLGILVFLIVGWSMRDLERAKKFRYLAVLLGIGFLVFTLLFGTETYGAKAWVVIGGMTLQPSELSKVCFVYAGASAMDRLMNKRNLFFFILYSKTDTFFIIVPVCP